MRDRERGIPVLAAVDDDVHALAQPHRGADGRILEAPHAVDPRSGRVHDRARVDRDRPVVGDDLGAAASEGDHLRVVENGRAAVGRRTEVRERQPPVVRPGVGVERTRAEPPVPKLRNHLRRPLHRHETVQPRPRQGWIDEDPALVVLGHGDESWRGIRRHVQLGRNFVFLFLHSQVGGINQEGEIGPATGSIGVIHFWI